MSERFCKDGGKCHHECAEGECFREAHCVPLSGSGLDDQWRALDTVIPPDAFMQPHHFAWAEGRIAEIVARFFGGSSSWDASDIRDLLDELRCEHQRGDDEVRIRKNAETRAHAISARVDEANALLDTYAVDKRPGDLNARIEELAKRGVS